MSPAPRSRALTGAFVALIALLAALVGLANAGFRELARTNRWSLHTHQVLTETAGLEAALGEMETAFRGFALTGDRRAVEAWRRARAGLEAQHERVRRLTADNPAQRRRVDAFAAEYRAWVAAQRATGIGGGPAEAAAAARARAADPAQVEARSARSAAMRGILAGIEADEVLLLRERAARARALERRTAALLLGGGLFAIVLAAGAAALAHRRTQRLRLAVDALAAESEARALARRAAERLARENALVLDAAAEGIYGVDAAGYTTFLNPAAARMLGYDAAELTGRPYEATLLSHSPGEDPIRTALLTGEARSVPDATFRRADGRRFPVEFTCAPIVEEGRVAGAVITFRDVEERREVDRMKDEFVSVVSHELRTPLTSIRGSLGLLASGKAGEVPERGKRMLEIAVQNTDRLIRLINDILDLERIESGKVAMEPAPVDAAELARHAAEVMQPMADRAGVSLAVEAGEVALVADADRVLQVLTNLLSNAVKFSPAGSVVRLTVEARGGEALFRVADPGRGIPADRLESVFERFQQVDSSDSRQKGGTGLGLAISRSIVQQHGGRIWAESEVGRGTVMVFTLPLPDAAGSEVAAPAGEGTPAEPRASVPLASPAEPPARVLLVEDDDDLAGVLLEMLRRRGVPVRHARTGREAVEAAARATPEVVVLDVGVPEGDGYWVAERLRADPALQAVPLVVYTARDLGAADRERLRGPRTEFLTKGRVEPAELERRVLALLAEVGEGARSG